MDLADEAPLDLHKVGFQMGVVFSNYKTGEHVDLDPRYGKITFFRLKNDRDECIKRNI